MSLTAQGCCVPLVERAKSLTVAVCVPYRLDEQLPIEYGRILLGCDKFKAEIAISEKDDNWNFDFTDASVLSYGSLLTGNLKVDSGFVGGYIAHLPHLVRISLL